MNSKSTLKTKSKGNSKEVVIKTNITLLPTGMYRVRKRVNGVRTSKNLRTIKACTNWLKGL